MSRGGERRDREFHRMNLALRMIGQGDNGYFGPELTLLDQPICTIGRRSDCTIVLDDPTLRVSRLHVTIVRHADGYTLMVSSTTNPVVLNGKVVPQGRSVPLREGDRIVIGDYRFQAEPSAETVPATWDTLRDRIGGQPEGHGAKRGEVWQRDEPPVIDSPWGEAPGDVGQETTPSIDDLLRKSGLATDASVPPETGIHTPAAATRQAFTHMPSFAAQGRGQGAVAEEGARILLEGAGLQGVRISGAQAEEFLRECGAVVRASVEGLMGLLLTRATAKEGLNVGDRTMLSSRENNPLKLISSVEEALRFVMDPTERTDAFLPPAQAISDACDDLRIHEIAMMAGMRAALAGALQRFDPALTEARLQKEGTPLLANRKSRLWDMFLAQYQAVQTEAADDIYALFEKDFLAAYQEQVTRLRR
jgi:type VI secretion system FHA domain protein